MQYNYIAYPIEGDIVGMTNEGEELETFPVQTAEAYRLWRAFNRASKDYVDICCLYMLGNGKGSRRLVDKLSKIYYDARDDLRGHLGRDHNDDDIFSKWHGRTTWVLRKGAEK